MPVAYVGAAAAAGSLALSVANSGGGGSSGGAGSTTPPPSYQPTGQPQADQNYQDLVGSMLPYATSIPNQVIPQLQTYAGNIQNNPYAATAQGGANSAAAYGLGSLAPMQQGGAAALYGAGQSALPYAQQILQTGFDPQQALYNQQFQQNRDQSNAIASMYGLGSSPAGAGLAQQSAQNFNINWQNQQLQRQATAAQGYGALNTAAGADFTGASGLGASGLATEQSASLLPYSTYYGQQTDSANAANSLVSGSNAAFGLDQNTLNALAAYLKLGQSATSVGQAGAAQNFAQQQTTAANIGNSLSSLANNPALAALFSSSSTPTNLPSTASSQSPYNVQQPTDSTIGGGALSLDTGL